MAASERGDYLAVRAGRGIRHRALRGAVTCIAVVNRAPGVDDRDVAFIAEACNQQAREVAAAHGVQYTPVVFYGTAEGLPVGCRVMTILPEIDEPGALGYHDDDLGVVFARVKASGQTSITCSHEVAEELVDPAVNLWAPYDVDHEQAIETCDRVEGDSYEQETTVLGETRPVLVSNYLMPSAFRPDGRPPFDRMGMVSSWNAMSRGGYVIVRDITTGKVGNVFADDGIGPGGLRVAPPRPRVITSGPEGAVAVAMKLERRGSRLLRRLRS